MKPKDWYWNFLKFLTVITGVQEAYCKRRHTQYHKSYQIEYNGARIVHCSKCYTNFIRY